MPSTSADLRPGLVTARDECRGSIPALIRRLRHPARHRVEFCIDRRFFRFGIEHLFDCLAVRLQRIARISFVMDEPVDHDGPFDAFRKKPGEFCGNSRAIEWPIRLNCSQPSSFAMR